MGALLKFVPYPVTVGFTAGIALIIFSSQVSDLLGLRIEKVPADFVEKWIEYGRHIGDRKSCIRSRLGRVTADHSALAGR